MYTVTKGAEAFKLATVIFEIKLIRKSQDLNLLRLTGTNALS